MRGRVSIRRGRIKKFGECWPILINATASIENSHQVLSMHHDTQSETYYDDIKQIDLKVGTLLCLIVVGAYIAFFQIFHPQNNFIMTPHLTKM